MAVQSGVLEQLEQQGVGAVTTELGMCAMELATSGSAMSVVGMVPVRWPVLLKVMGNEVPAFLRDFEGRAPPELLPAQQPCAGCSIPHATRFVASLSGQKEQAIEAAVRDMVLQKVQEAAGVSVGAHDPLMESGVDSLAATELQNSLQRELGSGVTLQSNLLLDYPTCFALVECISSEISQLSAGSAPIFELPLSIYPLPPPFNEPAFQSARTVELVAMASRLPGDWLALVHGESLITQEPPMRWVAEGPQGLRAGAF